MSSSKTSKWSLLSLLKGMGKSKTSNTSDNNHSSGSASTTHNSEGTTTTNGGPSKGSILRRMSDRRLVRQISSSLIEDPPVDCSVTFHESNSSLGLMESDGEDSVVEIFGSSSASNSNSNEKREPAGLTRKELQLGELLGRGGFSQVFALEGIVLNHCKKKKCTSKEEDSARQRLSSEASSSQLAVKHLDRRLLRRPDEFRAAAIDLEHEAQFLGCLNHRNIIKVRGVAIGGLTESLKTGNYNEFFLVMDRLTDTLDVRILRWNASHTCVPPDLATKTHYSLQLASALQYLHERRLVFRDLKPQNIGFLQDPNSPGGERLQLFDFGLCRLLPADGHITEDGETVYRMSQAGSRRYLSPEVYLNKRYNCKSDVYAWAMTCYEIIGQMKPFVEFRKPDRLAMHVCYKHGRPSLDSPAYEPVPNALKEILQQSWAGPLKERLTMAKIVAKLAPILEDLLQDDTDSLPSACYKDCNSSAEPMPQPLPQQIVLSSSPGATAA